MEAAEAASFRPSSPPRLGTAGRWRWAGWWHPGGGVLGTATANQGCRVPNNIDIRKLAPKTRVAGTAVPSIQGASFLREVGGGLRPHPLTKSATSGGAFIYAHR